MRNICNHFSQKTLSCPATVVRNAESSDITRLIEVEFLALTTKEVIGSFLFKIRLALSGTTAMLSREIGIRKSIGALRSSILAQFLVESAVVCGAGGVLGILVGVCGSTQ